MMVTLSDTCGQISWINNRNIKVLQLDGQIRKFQNRPDS